MAGYGGRDYRDPGYESEDSADYQPAPEEDEEIVDEPATFQDIQKELENSGAMGEALQRLLKLFEKQRLETQRLLSKAEEKETSQDFVNQVLTGILSKNVDATLALLARASPVCVMQIVDFNGMSALHHAAKLGLVVIVDALLEINPAVLGDEPRDVQSVHVDGQQRVPLGSLPWQHLLCQALALRLVPCHQFSLTPVIPCFLAFLYRFLVELRMKMRLKALSLTFYLIVKPL